MSEFIKGIHDRENKKMLRGVGFSDIPFCRSRDFF
jgi:hypothetical protein